MNQVLERKLADLATLTRRASHTVYNQGNQLYAVVTKMNAVIYHHGDRARE